MWGLVDCTRVFRHAGVERIILHRASMLVDTFDKAALFAPPGHGKTTIMRLLMGVDQPDSGTVLRDRGGWPLGYSGGFRAEMSGDANVRSLARLADVDADRLAAWSYVFSELGKAFYLPLSSYSGRMKARLGFAASFGLPARTYLADDKLSAGDPNFRDRCMQEIEARLDHCGLIFVTSNPKPAEQACDRFFVLEAGTIEECETYDEAVERLEAQSGETVAEGDEDDLPLFDLA
jgi:capsular polysaccharide transport system ATP-binding protein